MASHKNLLTLVGKENFSYQCNGLKKNSLDVLDSSVTDHELGFQND